MPAYAAVRQEGCQKAVGDSAGGPDQILGPVLQDESAPDHEGHASLLGRYVPEVADHQAVGRNSWWPMSGFHVVGTFQTAARS